MQFIWLFVCRCDGRHRHRHRHRRCRCRSHSRSRYCRRCIENGKRPTTRLGRIGSGLSWLDKLATETTHRPPGTQMAIMNARIAYVNVNGRHQFKCSGLLKRVLHSDFNSFFPIRQIHTNTLLQSAFLTFRLQIPQQFFQYFPIINVVYHFLFLYTCVFV